MSVFMAMVWSELKCDHNPGSVQVPVTKQQIEEEKARNMAIAARPIKKVLSRSKVAGFLP
jgi:hypothetical protein